jgi:AcrR family transcriptional regulator
MPAGRLAGGDNPPGAGGRRERLAEEATDYVLEHGIANLSLRPLAAAVGTSDRMLVYHFGTKDALVAEVIERSNDRSLAVLRALEPARSPGHAVGALWEAWHDGVVGRCMRVYAQAAALGLLGAEPYLGAARRANAAWTREVMAYLVRSGTPQRLARRVGELVDATLFGLWMDQPAAESDDAVRVVGDLAASVQALVGEQGLGTRRT